MGFGTLFIGYFFLLNVTYYSCYTDLIASLVMAIGLYKLANINKGFRYAYYTNYLFCVLGAAELVRTVIVLFFPSFDEETVIAYTDIPKYLIIAALTVTLLCGIRDVAREVGIKKLAAKSSFAIPVSLAVFSVLALITIPGIDRLIGAWATGLITVLFIIAAFALIIAVLTIIYSAYMHICMPEDVNNDPKDTPSRIGFVNKLKAHSEEKQKEYAEYKLQKYRKKSDKNRKK